MSSYYRGILAEHISKFLLLIKGYKILKTRFKTKVGEIDLICYKKNTVIFIEVKSRKNREQFLDIITHKQEQRIIKASQIFLRNKKLNNAPIRYDVIFITLPFHIQHITNAFPT